MLTRFVLCPTTPFPRPPHPCRCLPPCLTPSLVYSLHQSLRLCTCLSLFSSFSARSPSFSPSISSLLASFPLRCLCRFHRSISDFHSFSFVLSVRRERERERGRETERERERGESGKDGSYELFSPSSLSRLSVCLPQSPSVDPSSLYRPFHSSAFLPYLS